MFSYTVAAGDVDADGVSVGENALSLAGGTIQAVTDAAINAEITHTLTVDDDAAQLVDGVVPTVVDGGVVISSTGPYARGEAIAVTVTFSEAVVVDVTDGTPQPQILLAVGTRTRPAVYASGSGSTALEFSYTVVAGDRDDGGVTVARNALTANGGSILDAAGNAAALAHAAVAADGANQVDTAVPTVSAATINRDVLVLTYSEVLDDSSVPAPADYTLTLGSGTAPTVADGGVTVSGRMVTLMLGAAVTAADVVTLTYTAAADPVRDLAGNAAGNLTARAVINNTAAPRIMGIQLTSNAVTDNLYAIDEAIEATVTFSEAVTVTRLPELALTVGPATRPAVYASGSSTATMLVFSYTVVAGDSDADGVSIGENALTHADGSGIRDTADTFDAVLAHAAVLADANQAVDGVAPTVVDGGVVISSTGPYARDEEITLTVTFSEAVTVETTGGMPELALTVGPATRPAIYASGSDSTALVFRYTVADDRADDGVAVAVDALMANGGTIRDVVGNNALLAHAAVAANVAQRVDAAAPLLNTATVRDDVLTLIYNEVLDDSSVPAAAAYRLMGTAPTVNAGGVMVNGTRVTLMLSAAVQANDTVTLAYTADATPLRDRAGNPAASFTPRTVDNNTDVPSITAIALTSNAGDGVYAFGDEIAATVTFSEEVAVTGLPELALTVGTATRPAVYDRDSSTNTVPGSRNTLVFSYTVAADDLDTAGVSIGTNALTHVDGSTIRDAADTVDAAITHSVTVAADAAHAVDGVAPTVAGLVLSGDGPYRAGDAIELTATFSEAVTVDVSGGTPQIALTVGTQTRQAVYASGSSTATMLVFRYPVVAADRADDGVAVAQNALMVNDGTIRDAAGNDAVPAHAAIDATADHRVDNTVPTVSAATITGTALMLTYNEALDAAAAPAPAAWTLTLRAGSAPTVDGVAISGATLTLTLSATVVTTDTVMLAYTAGAIPLRDQAGNPAADFTGQEVINNTPAPPSITAIALTSNAGDGVYAIGETIAATVTFSEAVTVIDRPQLALTVGAETHQAVYTSGSGSPALVFRYMVVAGDNGVDGVSIAADALNLPAGSALRDTATDTMDAVVTHSVTVAADATRHRVDGVAPRLTGLVLTAGPYMTGAAITLTATFSEPVTVEVGGGTPQIALTVGSTARAAVYTDGSGTTALVFSYTVADGDNDGAAVAVALDALMANGGSIRDAAGYNAVLEHNPIAVDAANRVDAVVPVLDTATIDGALLVLAYREVLDAGSAPAPADYTLTLEVGDAPTVSGVTISGAAVMLTLSAAVVSTDNVTLAYTAGTTPLRDRAGNPAADLITQAVVNATLSLPRITGIGLTSDAGDDFYYALGDRIAATVTFSEPVTVVGLPELALTVGANTRTAVYDADASGSDPTTELVFSYTVAAGADPLEPLDALHDLDDNGVSIAENALTHAAGSTIGADRRAALLTHAAVPNDDNHRVDSIDPRVTGLVLAAGPYAADEAIELTATFSEAVVVFGQPRVALTVGTQTRQAVYLSSPTETTAVFGYTVVAGERDDDGVAVAANALEPNRGTIQDAAGNDAVLDHVAIDPVVTNQVETTPPTLSTLSSATVNGAVLTLTYSELLDDRATPAPTAWTLTLGTGATPVVAGVSVDRTTVTLMLNAVVQFGDTVTLAYAAGANPLRDLAGNPAADFTGQTVTNSTAASTATLTGTLTEAALFAADPVTVSVTLPDTEYVVAADLLPSHFRPTDTVPGAVTVMAVSRDDATTATLTLAYNNVDISVDGSLSLTVVAAAHTGSGALATNPISISASAGVNICTRTAAVREALLNAITPTPDDCTNVPLARLQAVAVLNLINQNIAALQSGDFADLSGLTRLDLDNNRFTTLPADIFAGLSGLVRLGFNAAGLTALPAGIFNGLALTFLDLRGNAFTPATGLPTGVFDAVLGTLGLIDVAVGNEGFLVDATVRAAHFACSRSDFAAIATFAGVDCLRVSSAQFDTYLLQTGVTLRGLRISAGTLEPVFDAGTADYTVAVADSVTAVTVTPTATRSDAVITVNTDPVDSGTASGSIDLPTPDTAVPITIAVTRAGTTGTYRLRVTRVAPPIITAIALTPNVGGYALGEVIEAMVTFSAAVTVDVGGGTPQIPLTVGTQPRQAVYVRGSTTTATALVFRYPVGVGDNDADGVAVAGNALTANSGTIRDAVGNDAVLEHAAIAADTDHRVDSVAPTVTGLGLTDDGPYMAGDVITLTATFSEAVTVAVGSGSPQIPLTVGTATRQAVYTGGSGSTALVFSYTVVAGDNADDGVTVAGNALTANVGSIRDAVGNAAVLAHDPIAADAAHRVDTVAPTVSGATIARDVLVLTYNEALDAGSLPAPADYTLTLGSGVAPTVSGVAINGATLTLTLSAMVVPADDVTLAYTVGATPVRDLAGNRAADLTARTVLNTTAAAPIITAIGLTSDADDDVYAIGEVIAATVTFSEAVTVTGRPQLALIVGTEPRPAVYASGDRTTALVFSYTVAAGDNDADGVSIAADALSLAGGSIRAAADSSINAVLTHTVTVADAAEHTVDGVVPTVGGVVISSTGPYTEGDAITLTATFSEAVTVDVAGGTPQIALTVGTQTRQAVYAVGSGTTALVFRHLVVAGDNAVNGVEVAGNALMTNGGSIRDAVGNAAALAHERIDADAAHRVDTAAPMVSMATVDGATLVLTYNEELDDSAVPAPTDYTLTLESGVAPTVAAGVTVDGQTVTLRLSAAVLPSDVVTLTTTGTNPVRDRAGNAAVELRDHSVDNRTMAIIIGVALTSNGVYAIGEAIEATVTFSDAVTVVGAPQLALTVGTETRPAVYVRSSSPAALGVQLHGGRRRWRRGRREHCRQCAGPRWRQHDPRRWPRCGDHARRGAG